MKRMPIICFLESIKGRVLNSSFNGFITLSFLTPSPTPLVEIQSQTMTAPYFTDRNVDNCCTSLVICSSPDPALLTSLSSFLRLLLLLLLHTTHYAEICQFFWLIAIWELSYFMHLKWCYFFFFYLFQLQKWVCVLLQVASNKVLKIYILFIQ